MKVLLILSILLVLLSCSMDSSKSEIKPEASPISEVNTEIDNTVLEDTIPLKLYGLDLFIDSMRQQDFYIDTNRLKEVSAWYAAANSPKRKELGHTIIELPFPIEGRRSHFSNPKTYFLAKWNEENESFKNGHDFLLMSWEVDSSGIIIEKEIYRHLISFMGNYPCYMFRDENKVYAIANRETNNNKITKALTQRLRDYINKNSIVFGHDNQGELIY